MFAFSTSAVAGTPLAVSLEAPQDAVMAPTRGVLGTFTLLALGVIALGAGAGGQLSRTITAPLADITAAAEAMTEGEAGVEAAGVERTDEVGRLARVFNDMAESVRLSRDRLELDVALRTADLNRAPSALESAQEELVRKERLATLGQLASSVGHELRNPLGVMTNSVYLLGVNFSEAPPMAEEYLGILQEQILISEKIVADPLDFARIEEPQRAAVRVADLIEEAQGCSRAWRRRSASRSSSRSSRPGRGASASGSPCRGRSPR